MPFGAGSIAVERLVGNLDPLDTKLHEHAPLRPAAVLAVILGGEPIRANSRLLLIERSPVGRHASQIAFPGGKPEPHDRDLLATALREANEEVSLPLHSVDVLGKLDPVPTPTGYFIVPYVARETSGWVPSQFNHEVTRVLTPTFGELADPAIHEVHGARNWRGRTYELHHFAICEPPLWGATARMVWDLLSRLRSPATSWATTRP